MIYCFDIDGTICSPTPKGMYDTAEPFVDVVEKINQLYSQGHRIIMMTARGSVSKIDYTELTKKQLKNWGVKHHELVMNKKPNADFYIDDKAVNIVDWRGKKTKGLVAGCFDIIHPGYIKMFEDARTVCEHLIIALHEDPSIDRKDKYKPLHSLAERELILKSIKYVDEVVTYRTEEQLESLIRKMKPDYRILGSDYIGKKITGKDIDGVEIHYHERDHDWSYSSLRRKIC